MKCYTPYLYSRRMETALPASSSLVQLGAHFLAGHFQGFLEDSITIL